jgi:N-acetylmuramoyl-L-alanine amidase
MVTIKEIPGVAVFRDVRKSLKKHPTEKYDTRSLRTIKHIVVHHSLTKSGSAEAYAEFHVDTNGWPGIGYHFHIAKDGSVDWTNSLETISYHVGNSNKTSVGIVLTGDFRVEKPTEAQIKSLITLIRYLQKLLNIPITNVKGHSEMPGYSWKECPCIDMNDLRKKVDNAFVLPSKPKAKTAMPDYYVVQPGDTLSNIAKHVGVSVEQLLKWNPEIKDPNKIQVGQRIRLKPSNSSSKSTASIPTKKTKYVLPDGILKLGNKGTKVKQLQEALNAINFNCGKADGIYGPQTQKAVKDFQSAHKGLKVDGIYGPQTKQALYEELKKRGLI